MRSDKIIFLFLKKKAHANVLHIYYLFLLLKITYSQTLIVIKTLLNYLTAHNIG